MPLMPQPSRRDLGKINLTNPAVEAMEVGAVLKDERVPGLEIRCHHSARSWLLYYRTRSGVQRRPKIGNYPIVSIALAREIARDMLAQVAMGKDPSRDRAASRKEPDIDALWERCEREHYNRNRKWDRDAGSIYRRHVKPRLGTTRIRAVTYDDVSAIHVRLRGTPIEANRTIAVLGKMLRLAERWGWRDTGSNPCQHVARYREAKRRRFATPDEMKLIGVALDKYALDPEYLTGVAFILLLIFSGARPSEIGNAKPSQLFPVVKGGVTYGVLRLAEAKTGPRDIYLPPQAMEVLGRLPGDHKNLAGRVTVPRKLWKLIQADVGCQDLWVRDFRRTFATVALSSGAATLDQLGELLGHASRQTTMIYAKLLEDKAHAAAAGIAGRMEKLLGGG